MTILTLTRDRGETQGLVSRYQGTPHKHVFSIHYLSSTVALCTMSSFNATLFDHEQVTGASSRRKALSQTASFLPGMPSYAPPQHETHGCSQQSTVARDESPLELRARSPAHVKLVKALAAEEARWGHLILARDSLMGLCASCL